MSDTPRTDAAERMAFYTEYMVPTDFSRELERELAEVREQRDTLANAIRQWKRKSWKDCKCDHGHDGQMPLQGEKCERCKLWDAVDLALVKGGEA